MKRLLPIVFSLMLLGLCHAQPAVRQVLRTGVVTGIKQPPYPEWFYRQIINDHGDVIREK